MPAVAILLAAFNGRAWIQQQIESILGQNGVDVTLFISVDKSTDGTETLVNELALKDKRIVVLPYGETFGGAAPNFYRLVKDVDFETFDYIALADQDDIWLENKLLRAYQILINSDADAYSSNVTAFWSDGRKFLIKKSQPQVKWDFLFEAAGPGCTYVFSRSLAVDIQRTVRKRLLYIQLITLHDWFFYAFARAHKYVWIIDDYSGMFYRQHSCNQVGVNHGYKAFMSRVSKVISGWGFSQALMISNEVGLKDDLFVRNWSSGHRIGMLYLALHANQCRRRIADKVFFFFTCLILCVTGN